MNNFKKTNGIISAVANVIANAVITFFVLFNHSFINVKGSTPNLLSVVLPAVFFSVFVTSLISFFILTIKRKKGEIQLPISAKASWFPQSILSGVLIGGGFAIIAFLLILIFQSASNNFSISKITAIILCSFVGAVTAYLSSFIAVNRAAKIQ